MRLQHDAARKRAHDAGREERRAECRDPGAHPFRTGRRGQYLAGADAVLQRHDHAAGREDACGHGSDRRGLPGLHQHEHEVGRRVERVQPPCRDGHVGLTVHPGAVPRERVEAGRPGPADRDTERPAQPRGEERSQGARPEDGDAQHQRARAGTGRGQPSSAVPLKAAHSSSAIAYECSGAGKARASTSARYAPIALRMSPPTSA